MHSLMYNHMWQSAVIALLHIERSILVFQRRTLLHPFPPINLSWVLSSPLCPCVPGLWLICLRPHVIKSSVSPPPGPTPFPPTTPVTLLFLKGCTATELRLFHSLLYSLCPFLVQMCFFFSRNGIWKCVRACMQMMFQYSVLPFHRLPTRTARVDVLGWAVFSRLALRGYTATWGGIGPAYVTNNGAVNVNPLFHSDSLF